MKKVKKLVKTKPTKKVKVKAKSKVKTKATKKVKVKAKANPKAKAKLPVNPRNKKTKSGYRELKDGSYSIYGWHVVDTPTEKFPKLVTISNKKKDIKKRFIDIFYAIKFIESSESERLILKHDTIIVRELKSLGLGILGAAPINESEDVVVTPIHNLLI